MAGLVTPPVRPAGPDDAPAVGALLFDFNTEFGDPTPPPRELARRVLQLLATGNTAILLGGDGPDAVAVLRFRLAIWSEGLEAYLAELYVRPAARGHGLGRAVMEAALAEARERGADTMDIAVDEPDLPARRLYESLGFRNRSDAGLQFFYDREL